MLIKDSTHLSYCTNIHAGESWDAVFESLQAYIPGIKRQVCPDQPFGIGLRLSNEASLSLIKPANLAEFKSWLAAEQCYVFTMNGFPYGGFHGTVVKDNVHTPDWQTPDRLAYTLRLFQILSALLPPSAEGGISTSPLTYKFWLKNDLEKEQAFAESTKNLLQVAKALHDIQQQTGQWLHLDIEPEPDGLLENTAETIQFYQEWLLPQAQKSGLFPPDQAEAIVLKHLTLCYDVCHFAVEYESPAWVFEQFRQYGIQIGKIQISAALKADLPAVSERTEIANAFSGFNESTYLHQVIARREDGQKTNFPDLPDALKKINQPEFAEWRTHFHVPIFVEKYGILSSTQSDIVDVLKIQQANPVTNHLEVETYTWEVLPEGLRLDLQQSIVRELEWVMHRL